MAGRYNFVGVQAIGIRILRLFDRATLVVRGFIVFANAGTLRHLTMRVE